MCNDDEYIFMRFNKTETLEINYISEQCNKNLFLLTWLWFILQNSNQLTSPILEEIYLAGKIVHVVHYTIENPPTR